MIESSHVGRLEVFAVPGIGEIHAGDDLAVILLDALSTSDEKLVEGDVVVITSKIVSKSEGRSGSVDDREAHVAAETIRPVAARRTGGGVSRIVECAAGPVMSGAGVDASNVSPGSILLLPKDPDSSARVLRTRLRSLTGACVGVIISDTVGRPWRSGQTDFALGAAGVAVMEDLRGATDTHGRLLRASVRAVADEIAAGADLVKGKLGATPIAIVRGLPPTTLTDEDGPGAHVLVRPPQQDWFRYGHVEAVRASLGIEPEDVAPPSVPIDDIPTRLARTLMMARPGPRFRCRQDATRVRVDLLTPEPSTEDWVAFGILMQRIWAAAWSEDLTVTLGREQTVLTVKAVDLA